MTQATENTVYKCPWCGWSGNNPDLLSEFGWTCASCKHAYTFCAFTVADPTRRESQAGETPRAEETPQRLLEAAAGFARNGYLSNVAYASVLDLVSRQAAEITTLRQQIAAAEKRIASLCDAHEEQFIAAQALREALEKMVDELRAHSARIDDGTGGHTTCSAEAAVFRSFADQLAALTAPSSTKKET